MHKTKHSVESAIEKKFSNCIGQVKEGFREEVIFDLGFEQRKNTFI